MVKGLPSNLPKHMVQQQGTGGREPFWEPLQSPGRHAPKNGVRTFKAFRPGRIIAHPLALKLKEREKSAEGRGKEEEGKVSAEKE